MELADVIWKALPQIAAAAVIGLCGMAFRILHKWKVEHDELLELKDEFRDFRSEFSVQHSALMESQCNQIKNTIVHSHETSSERGYITPWELDCMDRLADSYYKLGGNSYIHATMEKINDIPVMDEKSVRKRKGIFRRYQ